MKFYQTLAIAIAVAALSAGAAIAAEPNSALNTRGMEPVSPNVSTAPAPLAPLGAPSPIERTMGPNDGLTTPNERARLEQERQDRVRNPNAMERQMDRVEEGMGLERHKQPDVR